MILDETNKIVFNNNNNNCPNFHLLLPVYFYTYFSVKQI